MEEKRKFYKVLFLSHDVKPFRSKWGAWCKPQPHEDGYIMPLGWEEELSGIGVDFEVIEIEEQDGGHTD